MKQYVFYRYGVRADYVSADLSKVADINSLWFEVTRLYPDGIDILVNGAGITLLIVLCGSIMQVVRETCANIINSTDANFV